MSYTFQVIFAAVRLTVCFLLLFGWLSPKFLKYAGRQKGIDRIVYSWIGLGGMLVFTVFLLVLLHIYDFISLAFTLLILPVIYLLIKELRKGKSIRKIIYQTENTILFTHIRFLEGLKNLSPKQIKNKLFKKPSFSFLKEPYPMMAIILAASASIIRMIPAIENASPFSRTWYFELEAVKNLSLQQYFSSTASPKGMHSIIHIFSTITQVSPEMILHIMGSLTSFFLTVIIFWVIRDITKKRYQSAALFGAGLYALFPVLFMPITFELQTTSSSLSLALCFAIPTAVLFLRNIKSEGKTPLFYITMGILATGLIDLFVFLVVLIPFLIVSLIAVRKKSYLADFGRNAFYLLVICLFTLTPYLVFCLFNNVEILYFFKSQLFDSRVFNFNPNLIADIEVLSTVYLFGGLILLVAYILKFFIRKEGGVSEQIVFIILFCLVSFIYTPYFSYSYVLVDPDQLSSFYSVSIAVFFGLTFHSIFVFFEWIIKSYKKTIHITSIVACIGLACVIILFQGGIKVSKVLPQTLPNGFFNAYYKIISERVPYTYATVGPELDRALAQNRHFFMNYRYFLNNYGAIDSLYQKYLTVEDIQRENQEVPPASIFLFLEKAPYGSIQQGILYDSPTIMRDMEQWVNHFKSLENRTLDIFYENDNSVIYEIVNRKNESDINGVLLNMYPEEESRATKLLK